MNAGRDLFEHDPITVETVLAALRDRVGRARGVTAQTLALQLTGRINACDQRRLRQVIEALRRAGHSICAHPATGYFSAGCDADVDDTCEFLYARAMTSLQQISAMKRVALPDLRGQLGLPLKHPADDDDELPPCVGERMRDVLAERALATLADHVEDA